MKTKLIAAAAALVAATVGIAVIGTTSSAAPQMKFNFTCWPNFKPDGSGKSYTCSMNVGTVCKNGYFAYAPTVKQIKKNLYRVEYTCQQPPA
jgi:hypothetical protein